MAQMICFTIFFLVCLKLVRSDHNLGVRVECHWFFCSSIHENTFIRKIRRGDIGMTDRKRLLIDGHFFPNEINRSIKGYWLWLTTHCHAIKKVCVFSIQRWITLIQPFRNNSNENVSHFFVRIAWTANASRNKGTDWERERIRRNELIPKKFSYLDNNSANRFIHFASNTRKLLRDDESFRFIQSCVATLN